MSAKGGQKKGFPGQRPKSRAKEGHGRAPSQKQGSLAAMAIAFEQDLTTAESLKYELTILPSSLFDDKQLMRGKEKDKLGQYSIHNCSAVVIDGG